MPTPESKLQTKCGGYAKGLGFLAYKFKSPANRGVPDVLFITPTGQTFYVEFKRPPIKGKKSGELSPLQINTLRKFKKQGVSVYVCDNFEYFKNIINEYV